VSLGIRFLTPKRFVAVACSIGADAGAAPDPIHLVGPQALAGSVELLAERLEITCVEAGGRELICRFSSTYQLRSPGPKPSTLRLRFVSSRVAADSVDISGEASERPTYDSYVEVAVSTQQPFLVTWNGEFLLDTLIEPGFSNLMGRIGESMFPDALVVRHGVVWQQKDTQGYPFVTYRPSDIPRVGAPGNYRASVTFPKSWSFTSKELSVVNPSHDGQSTAAVVPVDAARGCVFRLSQDPLFMGGGPFASAKYSWERGWGAQAGVDLAFSPNSFFSASVESDFRSLQLVPAVEVSLPMLLVLPSFSVGAGAPVQAYPDFDLGGRLLLGATAFPFARWRLPSVAVFFSVDVWAKRDKPEKSLMLRIGL
jgi:hypothetical protein